MMQLAAPSTRQSLPPASSHTHRCRQLPRATALLPVRPAGRQLGCQRQRGIVRAEQQTKEKDSAQEATEKWGLEAGLWKVFTNKEGDKKGKSKGQQAKDLLARYGSAYLITSISFALVSFGLCYALVNSGVDVNAVLARVGLKPSDTGEKVGTFAIAYAAHKALSPVRFPPTVALTPVVAKLIGKEPKPEDDAQDL